MRQLVAATTVATVTTAIATETTATATAAAFATTVTAAATTTALTTAAETAAAARRTLFARTGDVHGQVATIEILAVEGLDGSFSRFRSLHGDEGETARATGELVDHQVDLDHAAMSSEQVMEIVFNRVEGKISYEQLSTH
jgi:hypothetical protein